MYVKELGTFLTMEVLEDTRQQDCRSESFAMNTGTLTTGSTVNKPRLIKDSIRTQSAIQENFVPIVVPGLSTSSSSAKSPSSSSTDTYEGRRFNLLTSSSSPHLPHQHSDCAKATVETGAQGRPVWDSDSSSPVHQCLSSHDDTNQGNVSGNIYQANQKSKKPNRNENHELER